MRGSIVPPPGEIGQNPRPVGAFRPQRRLMTVEVELVELVDLVAPVRENLRCASARLQVAASVPKCPHVASGESLPLVGVEGAPEEVLHHGLGGPVSSIS